MSLPPSNSESAGFDLLDPAIQRWVWREGWTSLRDAQERAIPALLNADRDVIIAASTAAGKTEAAFLPILTNLLKHDDPAGSVIYVSPLKALINDQWGRLETLCEELDIPVVAWHGDISASRKHRFVKSPRGILLITPESLEAMFVNRGSGLAGVFANLRYLVVDELHAFIGSERGKQLQSLLHRIELVVERTVPRVGLSATLGDMKLASAFLRPRKEQGVEIIESKSSGQVLKVQVRGYVDLPNEQDASSSGTSKQEADSDAEEAIAAHLYQVLRGSNNLVFPNSRQKVERYADRLRRLCESDGVPNEFWPHHGNLSKDVREETEQALKAGNRPATAVCTTTLELGIDIGSIRTVGQIGSPPSVASLRQRLGRSGRRQGESAILRGYCEERSLSDDSSLSDRLRQGLVQSIAMIRLLMDGWFEPPRVQGCHYSTLVQQVLSIIAQRGGAAAGELWRSLVATGPFSTVAQSDFLMLLRAMGEHDLVVQEASGLLLPGESGERFINHYDFYSAFVSDEEFRLICDGKALGSLPVSSPLSVDQRIIFAGRRWQVAGVDESAKVVVVKPSPGGAPPLFDGVGARVHDQVREEMKRVLGAAEACPFLDSVGQELLDEARCCFNEFALGRRSLVDVGAKTVVFTWRGDWTNDALAILLKRQGIQCESAGLLLEVESSSNNVREALQRVAESPAPLVTDLLADVKNMVREKWDWVLPSELLAASFASTYLDIEGARSTASALSSQAQR
ncbi:DEAD/DEAH box helicase [Pseudomonas sp. BGr12]|uniref:DEAD/DEAH box helicase n=1 Tax=Pseudomonas sp. BGr12 TaxID=2936269 RepID=UPI002559526A|nr:DEAD/DEAH box helicase [Pseudomonas sp. BJa5]MDL2428485.1 DEAD/DEAH box helicase [Pseudomonas sp. BJa5]